MQIIRLPDGTALYDLRHVRLSEEFWHASVPSRYALLEMCIVVLYPYAPSGLASATAFNRSSAQY
jgi:hypothetical protein